jgi:activator of 2-hydroxyglutaryl-CoA dehydratase
MDSMKGKSVYVGIDIGSISANTVVVDSERNVIEEHYTRTMGEPIETAHRILSEIVGRWGRESISFVATTGAGGKLITPLIGASPPS